MRALGYKKTMHGIPTVHSDTLRRPLRYNREITDIRCSQDIREVDACWTLWALYRILCEVLQGNWWNWWKEAWKPGRREL